MNSNYISIIDNNNDLKFFSYKNKDNLKNLISTELIKKSNPINIDDGFITDDKDDEIYINRYCDTEKNITLELSMNSYTLVELTFRDNGDELKELFNKYNIIPLDD